MKLQRTPLILLIVALGLGGFVYFYEVKGAPQREAAKESSKELFAFEEGQVQTLTVKTPEQTLSFERASEAQAKSTGSLWVMKEPADSPASEASVAYLLNLLATSKSERTLTAPASQKAEFGFDKPTATIEVQLNNQTTHQLILGKTDFNGSSYYAQTDPPKEAENLSVQMVSPDFGNAINRPLAEWKQAPKSEKSETNKKTEQPKGN
jgi:hypothetical protein